MANNKMWLVNSVTGQRVMIASTSEGRAGTDSGVVAEWVTPGGIEDKLDRAFVEEFESSTSATGSTAWCIEYESGLRSLETPSVQSEGLSSGLTRERLTEMARSAAEEDDAWFAAKLTSGIGADAALRDLLLSVARMASVEWFDDDQDPGLDSPVERVLRGFGRWNALLNRGPAIVDPALIREPTERGGAGGAPSGIRWDCSRCGGSFVTSGDVGDAGREHESSCPSTVARLAQSERALDSARGELSSVNSVLDLAGVGSASFAGSRVEMLVKRRDALASASTDQAIQIAELRGELRQERERERVSIAAHQQIASAVAESAHVDCVFPVKPMIDVKSTIDNINSRLRRWPGLRRAKLGGFSGTAIAAAVNAADCGVWSSPGYPSVSVDYRDKIVGELTRLSEIDISSDHGAGFTESDRDEVVDLLHVVAWLGGVTGIDGARDRPRVTLPIPSDAELSGLVRIRTLGRYISATGGMTSASQATAADLWIDRVVRIARGIPRDGDVDSGVAVQVQARGVDGVDGETAAGADALASAGMSGDVVDAGSMTWRTLIAELGRLIFGEYSSVALDRPVVLRVGFGDCDSADSLARDRVGFLRAVFVDDGRGAPPALTMDADATRVAPELGRASSPRRDSGAPIAGASVTSGPAGDRMRDGVVVDLSAIQLACARAMERRPRDGSPPMVSISLDVLIAVAEHARSIGEYVLELSRVAGGASCVDERIVELVKRGPVVAGDGGADACDSTVEIIPSSWLARRATSVVTSLDWLARAREVVVDLDTGMLKWPFDDPAEVSDLGRRAADLLRSVIESQLS